MRVLSQARDARVHRDDSLLRAVGRKCRQPMAWEHPPSTSVPCARARRDARRDRYPARPFQCLCPPCVALSPEMTQHLCPNPSMVSAPFTSIMVRAAAKPAFAIPSRHDLPNSNDWRFGVGCRPQYRSSGSENPPDDDRLSLESYRIGGRIGGGAAAKWRNSRYRC